MKKNLKIASLTAVALLAIAPIAAPLTNNSYSVAAATTNYGVPAITYNGRTYTNAATVDAPSAISNIALNGMQPTSSAVTKYFSSDADLSVSFSSVNVNVAGRYPVTVTASDGNRGNTTLTFYVTVGTPQANYTTVQGPTDGVANVYKIDGSSIDDSNINVYVGDQIATFGEITGPDGKKYTRLNSSSSDLYIKSSFVNNTYDPNAPEYLTKKLMVTSKAYTKTGKSKNKKYMAYHTVKLEREPYYYRGVNYYQVYGTSDYLKAINITGEKYTLTKNSYIYKTSKKRANKRF